jgi:predicted  nucleic acid-binding Zn-ribbon protein
MRGDYSSLVATFESATESHQEQMDKVKDIHEQELLARDELIERYSERLTELEIKHSDNKEALLEEYAKRKKAYVIAFGKNGEGIKKDIENYFGIEYVSP